MIPIQKYYLQKVKNYLWHLPKSIYFKTKFKNPSKNLTLIGVTGTDGKTTTAKLIYEVLTKAGIKTGLITTIGAKTGNRDINTGLHMTSPDPSLVQQIFQEMVKSGLTHAVIEVTSHALDQFRFFGCHFKVSVITNTSHEHLDDFIDMHRYIHAKNKIFHYSDIAILNKDDQSFKQISKNVTIPSKTYSIDTKSTYQATNIKINQDELTFKVNQATFKTNSNYYYQIYNILAAYSVINTLNIDTNLFLSVIKDFPEVAGRRQTVPNNLNFKTIIDFAHTPAALESTLSSLKKLTKGNLIVIFGATGGRDKSKRPLMGAVVSQHADIAILTSDDTRNEKVEDINQQIAQGIKANSEFFNYVKITSSKQFQKISLLAQNKFVYLDIPNRQDAFNFAVKLAQPGDTVIACGKGHETSILHGTTEYPWSESEAFRTAFRLKTQL